MNRQTTLRRAVLSCVAAIAVATSAGCAEIESVTAEPYEPAALTGNTPSDLQTETARLSGAWKLGKLNEISDEQAREDLGRLSSQMMGIVARSARLADGATDAVAEDVVALPGGLLEDAGRLILGGRGE